MKLCKLKLKNINSFRGEEELDFEDTPLHDASLVAITGPTGAGKTTLLDAICVALYGKTPRLTGSGTQNPKNLISHGEKECFAEVHFIANNTRYIATWSAKQSGSPNGSLFYADSEELITDRLSKKGKSLGTSENTISEEIKSIFGLDFDGFQRSIMLAQGEFAAFLKASDEDRRKILETTAGIHIYDNLKLILTEQVNEVSEKYNQKKSEFDFFADTSPEQVKELNDELDSRKEETKKLNEKLQQIESDKKQETERKNQYEKLETSKKRLNELKNEQPKIDEYKLELENAELANQLRAEKQVFDTTQLDHQKSKNAFNNAKTELKATQKQVKINQSIYDEKEKLFTELSTSHSDKSKIYTQAKSELERASERFKEVNKRRPPLKELDTDIVNLTNDISNKQQRQKELQNQILEVETFLDQNRLPSDRDARLIRLSRLQENINGKQKQLIEKSDEQSERNTRKDALSKKVKALSKKRDELHEETTTLGESLKIEEQRYNELQDNGSLEDWQRIKDIATSAQLIVQNHEISSRQLNEEKKGLRVLQDRLTTLDESLEELEEKLENQSDICEIADVKVEELEKVRELAMLADSVNHLRHKLEDGEPCYVCGATEHPYADKVESERDEQIRSIDEQLSITEKEAKKAHKAKRKLEQEQVRVQQDKLSNTEQLDECTGEIESLKNDVANSFGEWQELYEKTDISRQWIEDRIKESDKAIDNLTKTRDACNKARNDLSDLSRDLSICDRDHTNQSNLLNDTKHNLNELFEEIEDLKADIELSKTNFLGLMPESFHADSTEQALSDFSEMIDNVNSNELKLKTDQHQFALLNSKIESGNSNLATSKHRKNELTKEIEQYQNEGDEILKSVSEKTGGLNTIDEINLATSYLNAELQAKKVELDEAQQKLQETQELLVQRTTAHQFCNDQLVEDNEKFQAASNTYHEKLEDFGFGTPEDHNAAFRKESQIQELKETIEAHEDEIQSLNDTISKLTAIFENSPYNPEKLLNINTEESQIDGKIQNLQQDIGRKQQIIKDLEEKLDKRKTLDKELKTAKQEMDRWKSLRDIIPQNKLRDFALDIMFQQVSKIANVQLEYLTSERYQLKVETIGKLSVIDRWNANEERPVETLSGGESFLTSLALALALSELSQGRTQLTSLFLDEGFGTLDAETLDIAIAALEGLRVQGRNIYIISHIQELTRRLPVKINVKKKGDGSSTIDING